MTVTSVRPIRRWSWPILVCTSLLLLASLVSPLTPVAQAADVLPTVWYFAEGYTGTGFDEYLTIQNPNPATANVRVTYYKADATTKTYDLTVAGQSRGTVTVHDPVQGIGRIDGLAGGVSAKVESLNAVGIVVERPMYFTYNGAIGSVTDGHNVMGATAPRSVWYFAEGYTGTGFEEYLTIMNPNAVTANVTITYYRSALGGGTPPPPIVKSVVVNATSRYTVEVHKTTDGVGLNEAVSAKVETDATTPIVVERPMYFIYNGASLRNITGGHNVIGANAPQPAWYFPFASTGSTFDTYATIMNIFGTDAQVRLTFYPRAGATTTHTFTVAANSRYTLNLRDSPAVGANKTGGFKIETLNGVNLVVERPMYFIYTFTFTANGGINGLGAAAPNTVWLFAEGFTGTNFHEYLELLNPSTTASTVEITYSFSSGPPKTTSVSVPALTEKFVWVNDSAQAGANKVVSARVAVTSGGAIVAERLMFFRYNNVNDGGHGIIGYPVPQNGASS